jgi:hypothetical protein
MLEHQGQRQEARTNYEMFLRFAGDLPMIFGRIFPLVVSGL